MGMAKAAGGAAKSVGGGMAKAGFAASSVLTQAGAAAGAVKDAGGSKSDQRGAFMSSMAGSAKDAVSAKGLGLARSLLGGRLGEQSTLKEHYQNRKAEGRESGLAYLQKNTALPEPSPVKKET